MLQLSDSISHLPGMLFAPYLGGGTQNAQFQGRAMNAPAAIESYLPLSRMAEAARSARKSYANAKPFPHVVLDDFFDPALLDRVLAEFPKPGAIKWKKFDTEREIKLANAAEANFGPVTRLLLYHLNSQTFLEFVSAVTGIAGLVSDPYFEGGGLHQIVRGGKLGVHVDFNKHSRLDLDRRVNVLVYLNKDWRDEYGGHLQLWTRDMTRCEARVAPLFNRLVMFGTTDFTYHGHPDPLQCPEGMTRKSLALYYFTNGRPADEISESHNTVFQSRTKDEFKKLSFRHRMRRIALDVLPPVVTRQLRRILRSP
jgi:hypothetical protein